MRMAAARPRPLINKRRAARVAAVQALYQIEVSQISAQKVVKVFRRSESVIAVFRQRNEDVYRAGEYANTYALLLMPLTINQRVQSRKPIKNAPPFSRPLLCKSCNLRSAQLPLRTRRFPSCA